MESQTFLRLRHTPFTQICQCLFMGRRGQNHLPAAALDGRQNLIRRMAYQQKDHLGRRFFQHFQQTVGSLDIHAFGRMDEDHAQASPYRSQIHVTDNFPDGVDFNLQQFAPVFRLIRQGGYLIKIRMSSLFEQMARRAYPARSATRYRAFA